MWILLLIFLLWCAGSYLIFTFLAPWCIVAYGLLTLAGFLVWAVTRPGKKSLDDKSGN